MYEVRILLAEDEASVRKIIARYVENEGYKVIQAQDGEQAIEVIKGQNIDLAILDIMMPKIDGYQVCRYIKEQKDIPVIMLTARSSDMDKIKGFKFGADQYVTKPFSNQELIARVNSLLKKKGLGSNDICVQFKNIKINIECREVIIDGDAIYLTPKEYDMLLLFLDNKNKVLTRNVLLDRVWGYESYVDDRTVDTLVKRLRKKINGASKYIKTIRGVGYMLEDR